jgi:hypothetical protein
MLDVRPPGRGEQHIQDLRIQRTFPVWSTNSLTRTLSARSVNGVIYAVSENLDEPFLIAVRRLSVPSAEGPPWSPGIPSVR